MKKTKLLIVLCLMGCMAKAQIISTYAGNGTAGFSGNGGQATSAELQSPDAVVLDASGNLYIADAGNSRIRKVTTSGIISTYVGSGTNGFSGDGGQATAAEIWGPTALAFDANGNLFFADASNNRLRKVTPSGIISTIAGNGTAGTTGNGGQATAAEIWNPRGIAVDASGNIYFSDYYCVRKVTTPGIISTIAGNGGMGGSGDGGQATAAEINQPFGLAVDASGNLYITENADGRIRMINTSGIINTIAGNATTGYSGDGGQATAAELRGPTAVAIDAAGNLFIADYNNNRIRMVSANGIINTIAGNGTAGYSGDGGAASSAELNLPEGITCNTIGTLYIADYSNNRIRKVTIPQCVANAGSNVSNSTLCMGGVTIGTSSVSGSTYAWSPTTALSCTNCAQPNSTYTNTSSPQVYTLTVMGACLANTSTVQVTAITPSLTAHIPYYTSITSNNITANGTYSGNTTPNNYYWQITQCSATGGTVTPAYNYSVWTAGAPSGTYTFANTSTLTCNTYYQITFAVQNTAVCLDWAAVTSPVIETTLDANFTLTSALVSTGNYSATATFPSDNPSGISYLWDVVELNSSGTGTVTGSDANNPSCWWTYPSSNVNTFNGYENAAYSASLCAVPDVGNFTSPNAYQISFGVWSSTCAWTENVQTLNFCGSGCRTAENPDGIIISQNPNVKHYNSYEEALQNGAFRNQMNDVLLSIYPNPNAGSFTVESNSNLAQLIQMFDVNGKLVLSQTINGTIVIDAASLPDGVYNLNITGNNSVSNKKLVIVR